MPQNEICQLFKLSVIKHKMHISQIAIFHTSAVSDKQQKKHKPRIFVCRFNKLSVMQHKNHTHQIAISQLSEGSVMQQEMPIN